MTSNICAEQRKLEEDENDGHSEAGSLNDDLLDESMEEDDTREPAVTYSAAKRIADDDISAAAVVHNKVESVPSAPALNLSIPLSSATPDGGQAAANSIISETSPKGGLTDQVTTKPVLIPDRVKQSGTFEAINLFKRTSSNAPNLLGGAGRMIGRTGSLYLTGDSRCTSCFTDFRFNQKLNVMMSFNPNELECRCCPEKVLVDHRSINKTGRRVFVLADQNFPASTKADNSRGQCIKIIRVENGTLWEIFGIFHETIGRGRLHVPAGSVVLLGSASHLADVGLTAYIEELCAVAQRIQSLQGGCIYFSPCPMLLLDGSNNSMLIRAIIELTAWSNVVFADSVSYCAGAMRDAASGLRKNSTGDCATSSCRLLLPAGLRPVSF